MRVVMVLVLIWLAVIGCAAALTADRVTMPRPAVIPLTASAGIGRPGHERGEDRESSVAIGLVNAVGFEGYDRHFMVIPFGPSP